MMPSSAPKECVRGKVFCDSNSKQIYAVVDEPHLAMVVNKKRVPAPNLPCKAECTTTTNAAVFKFLNDAGVKTSFVRQLTSTSFLARRCTMIPFKWVVRRIATGSFLKRNPEVQEGYRFSPVKIETFYKVPYRGRRATCLTFEFESSAPAPPAPPSPPSQYEVSSTDIANSDPEWNSAQVLSFPFKSLGGKPVSKRQYRLMADTTSVVFEVFERMWAGLACTLIDMKVEYGIDQETGEILLSDVIDNDCWCLWDGNHNMAVDKQVYRDFAGDELDKGKLDYVWVQDQLHFFTWGYPNTVVIIIGSPSDRGIGDEIKKHCDQLKIQELKVVRRMLSAHQVTEDTLRTVRHYNGLSTPVVFVAVAAPSTGLATLLAGNTTLPVINCPPFIKEVSHDGWSSVSLPSGLSCCTVMYPEAAALHAASIFAVTDHRVWARLRVLQLERRTALCAADHDLQTKDLAEIERNN